MSDEQPEPPKKRGKKKRLAALLLIWGIPLKAAMVGASMTAALTALAVASTGILTNSQVVEELAFDAGGLDLTVSPGSALVTMTTPSMTPGDSFTAPLVVGNAGHVELRYALMSTTTEDILAGELLLTVRSEVADCEDRSWQMTGTELYRGPIGAAASTTIFGSPAIGAQAGDRTIIGGEEETLCFSVTLPLTATNAAQGTTSTATFTFFAEQTAEAD